MIRLALALAACLAITSPASQIVESFSDPSHFQQLAAPLLSPIFNLVTQQFQVPYAISEAPAPLNEDYPFSIGNGQDGPFGPTTYAAFDVGGKLGQAIVTLSAARVYQFTSFELGANLTLTATGSAPLEIHVQGSFTLDAGSQINLSGTNGTSAGAAGQGVAGGKAGGAGGVIPSRNGSPGIAADAAGLGAGGGGQGNSATNTGGGGGGAGHLNDESLNPGNTGTGGLVNGGTGGAAYDNVFPTNALGGSGGGGGGANATVPGGGGGGGGGVLKLFVGGNLTISATSGIHADGGNGGDGGVTTGAGGGPGSGGTLLLFAAGTADDEAQTGAGFGVTVSGGTGGAGPSGAGGGGIGSDGMIWNLTGKGAWGPHGPFPPLAGTVFFSMKSYRLQTGFYDTGLTGPTYGPVSVQDTSAQGDTIQYSFAGASDASYQPTDHDFVDKSQIAQLNGRRYLMLRVQLQGTSSTRSPSVSKVAVDFGQPSFSFRTQGCARVGPEGVDLGSAVSRTLLLFFPAIIPWLLRRRRSRRARS